MARRVFFSFHYDDVSSFRANVVRQSWVTQDRTASGFFDASIWEDAKKQSDVALKRLINGALNGTSVTAVLAGTYTYSRRWVRYEIAKSFERGNGLLNIYIHNIPDKTRSTSSKGPNPLDYLYYRVEDTTVTLWEFDQTGQGWVPYSDLPSFPLYNLGYVLTRKEGQLSSQFMSYDWVTDNGYRNISAWVEAAARRTGQ